MLTQSLRASRSSIARAARCQSSLLTKRTFITPTAIRQADLVQDLYLRELKGYKSPAVKPSDAEGHVQKWVAPKAPQSPEESDIASELKSYESSAVEVEGQAEAGAGGAAGAAEEQDWFEEEPEEEEARH